MGKSYKRNRDDDYDDYDYRNKKGDNKKRTRNFDNALRQKDVEKLMSYNDDSQD